MKVRLLALPPPGYFPLDLILTDLLLYTQTKGGSAGFTNRADIISASCKKKSLFVKTSSIFPFWSELQFTSETIAGLALNIHYVVNLKV